MAAKEKAKDNERTYNVPLRKEFMKAPKYKRAKKAVTALRAFIAKHMKAEKVSIGKHLNDKIWERGIKNPPHHVKVNAVKDSDGKAIVELFGVKIELPKEKAEPKETAASKEKIEKEIKKLEEKTSKIVEKKEDKLESKLGAEEKEERPKAEKKEAAEKKPAAEKKEVPKEKPAEKPKEDKAAPKKQ